MHDLIGNSQDEAGAFLTVLPRRVFLHVDPTPEARAAVEWAAARLLVPDTDEVFLVHVPPPPAHSLLLIKKILTKPSTFKL